MTIKQVEDMYLSTKEGKSAGRMKLWIDDNYIKLVDEETGEEKVAEILQEYDEDLMIEIVGILAQYSRPLTVGFIRKTINTRSCYKKTTDIEIKDILTKLVLDEMLETYVELGLKNYYIK